jgi:hypothetical protein
MVGHTRRLAATFALVCVTVFGGSALAQDRPYTEGPVVNVAGIRTIYGKTDEYMKFLAGPWKQEQEALKKAGVILSYQVLAVEPRGEDDPDIYLVITYKNWAALDGLNAKTDAATNQVWGSIQKSNASAVDRGEIRRVVGSTTMQVLELK